MGLLDRARRLLPGAGKETKPAEITGRMQRRQFEIQQAQVLARLERIRIDAEVRDQPRKDTQK